MGCRLCSLRHVPHHAPDMKLSLTLVFCGLLSLGLLAQLTTATSNVPFAASGQGAHDGHGDHKHASDDGEEESLLVQAMDVLHSNERLMKKALKGDGDVAGALIAVVGMQEGAGLAKKQAPPLVEGLELGQRAAFLKGFRLEIIGLQRDLLALEEALLNGDLKEAKAQFAKVREREKAGHDRYSE